MVWMNVSIYLQVISATRVLLFIWPDIRADVGITKQFPRNRRQGNILQAEARQTHWENSTA